jgi:hypothetical protein
MVRHGGRQMTQPLGTGWEDTTPGGTAAWRREAWLVREQAPRLGLALEVGEVALRDGRDLPALRASLTLRWCGTPDGLIGVWDRQVGRATQVTHRADCATRAGDDGTSENGRETGARRPMDTRAHEASLEHTHTHRGQAVPPDGRTASPGGREQRPGLRSVATRWPHLSAGQTRQLYDLVYGRAPE